MTHEHHLATIFRTIGVLTLVILFLFCGTTAAGSIFIDTNGIPGKAGEMSVVPVKVTTDNAPLYLADLHIYTTDNAVIKYNQSSIGALKEKGARVQTNDETGILSGFGFTVKGTNQFFFSIDVTPDRNAGENIALYIELLDDVGEGTSDKATRASYTTGNAVLNLGGSVTPPATPSPTPSGTPSPTPSVTPSPTPSGTPSPTPSVTPSPTPSVTPSPTPSVTPSPTPSVTPSPTPTPTGTGGSSTVIPTATPSTPTPSETVPTLTPAPTDDKPDTGVSYIPWIIAAVVVLGFLILIIIIVRRRREEQ